MFCFFIFLGDADHNKQKIDIYKYKIDNLRMFEY